jgi:hypothetical protein
VVGQAAERLDEAELRRRVAQLETEKEELQQTVKVKLEVLVEERSGRAQLQERVLLIGHEARELRARLQALKDEAECCVCMERAAGTAFVPCGHCFCNAEECLSATFEVCPTCSEAVRDRTRLFGAVGTLGDMMGEAEPAPDAPAPAVAAAMEGGYPAAAGGYPNNTGVVGAGGYPLPSAGGVAGAYPLPTNKTGVAPPPTSYFTGKFQEGGQICL